MDSSTVNRRQLGDVGKHSPTPTRFDLSRWSLEHPAFTVFLIIAILISGVWAYWTLGRAEDPSFKVKTAIVSAEWPGATAAEVQDQVADPVETRLRQLPYLDFLRTYCLPGQMLTLVQLRDDIPSELVDEAWYQTRKKLFDLAPELPRGVLGPAVNDEYGDVYSAIYSLTGEGYSPRELKALAKTIRDQLLQIPTVEKVDLLGDRPEKIYVDLHPELLARRSLAAQQVAAAIDRHTGLRASGRVDTDQRLFVRVDEPLCDADELATIPITAGAPVLRLGDVATVRDGYDDPPATLMRYNGRETVAVGVVMVDGGNVLELGERLEVAMTKVAERLPAGVEVEEVAFQPRIVDESVHEFLKSFAEALAIVLGVSLFTLGLRTGIIVAVSVPIVLALTFTVMAVLGMDFDRISLGALILALGLLVDDAIIAIEMMAVRLEEGYSRAAAATAIWGSTAFPMLSGTLITAAGFLPVGFAKSAAGEYAGGIFWVVGISLIISWFVAVMFIPYLGYKWLPEKAHVPGNASVTPDRPFRRAMRWTITTCVRYPYLCVGVTAVCLTAALWGFTQLQQQFFPVSSRLEVLVDLTSDEGTSIETTDRLVEHFEQQLERIAAEQSPGEEPLFSHYASYVGVGSARFFLALNPDLPNPNFGKIVIMTTSIDAREQLIARLSELAASDEILSAARCRIKRLEFGPPTGFPVQFRLTGPDRHQLQQVADEMLTIMQDEPQLIDPHVDGEHAITSVRIDLDYARLAAMSIDPGTVRDALQMSLQGSKVAEIRRGTERVDVVMRYDSPTRSDPERIGDVLVAGLGDVPVPLRQVGRLRYQAEEPILWRRNQENLLTVRADVADGFQAPDVSLRLQAKFSDLLTALPAGVRVEMGGGIEESLKANRALFAVFPVMILVMWTLLMLQVQNFRKAALVFGIAPLGLIGATLFLHLFSAPFGFVALLGVIALAGMDMRNSVILIDQIEANQQMGLNPWRAVIEAAVLRARPVILTAATAILAMIPLSRSVFWGPMAIAIMGGLALATFLTLLNLPALYVILFRIRPDGQLKAG